MDAQGQKRPYAEASTRVGRNGEPLSEKRLRRLEKNRVSARECRRRKREATEHMQREINQLEGENLRLRLQLQVGEEAEQNNQMEQQKMTEGLDALLKGGGSEGEIAERIEEYQEKFADYGRDRRSAIEFHLRNIERLLMPTQTTSVIMATLHMGQDAATTAMDATTAAAEGTVAAASAATKPLNDITSKPSNVSAKSLFQHLVKILEVTPEQAQVLKDSRLVAEEMDRCLKTSLGVLNELQTRLTQCGEDLDNEFNNVRSILTPTQAAKFLVWVANNKACMHMLNELWNRVYPQSEDDGQPSPRPGLHSLPSGGDDDVESTGDSST